MGLFFNPFNGSFHPFTITYNWMTGKLDEYRRIKQGPNLPLSGFQQPIAPVGNLSWSNASNITSSDDVYATSTYAILADEIPPTIGLYSGSYGFAIPEAAIIRGIEVTVEKKCSHSGATEYAVDSIVVLLKHGTPPNNPVAVGSNKADTSTKWNTSDTVVTYGSATDLWGTSWNPADINNLDFGVGIGANLLSSGPDVTVYVDAVTITVYYSMPDDYLAQEIKKENPLI